MFKPDIYTSFYLQGYTFPTYIEVISGCDGEDKYDFPYHSPYTYHNPEDVDYVFEDMKALKKGAFFVFWNWLYLF